MARIPEYEQSVGIGNAGVPRVEQEPMPQGMMPTEIAGAGAKMGAVIENLGDRLSTHMIEDARMQETQKAYDAASAYRSDLQDKLDGQNGFVTRQGTNAAGSTIEYDKITQGLEAQPGEQGQAPLKDKYRQGLSKYGRAIFDRSARAYTEAYRGQVIKHEATQKQFVEDKSAAATEKSFIKGAGAVSSPDDLGPLIANAHEYLKTPYFTRKGMPEAAMNEVRDNLSDKMISAAVTDNVDRNPKLSQAILEAHPPSDPKVGKDLQNAIDGKLLDIIAHERFDAFASNPKLGFQNPIGLLDMGKVKEWVNTSDATKDMAQDKRDKMFKLMQGQENERIKNLSDGNKANTDVFNAKALDPKTPLDDARRMAVKYAERYADGSLNQKDLDSKLKLLDQLHRLGAAKDDFDTYVKVHAGVIDGTITSPDDITKAMEDGLLTEKTARGFIGDLQKGTSTAMRSAWEIIDRDLSENQYPGSVNSGIRGSIHASIHAQAIEKRISDPVELQKLYQENLKSVPTGEASAWKLWLGNKNEEYYKSAERLQKNAAVVKAMGGVDPLYKLALKMGGPDTFAPDTPQSNAVIALKKYGRAVTPETIAAFIQKNPGYKP